MRSLRHVNKQRIVNGGYSHSTRVSGYIFFFFLAHKLIQPDALETHQTYRTIMIPQTIHTLVTAASPPREDFKDPTTLQHRTQTIGVFTMMFTLIIVVLLVAFVGFMLWNSVIAGAGKDDSGLFTFAKKANSYWQILGLFLFSSLFFGGCCPTGAPVS